jgi:hypothetical protein
VGQAFPGSNSLLLLHQAVTCPYAAAKKRVGSVKRIGADVKGREEVQRASNS